MTQNQKHRQHAQRISSVATLNGGDTDLGIEREIFRSWKRCLNDDRLDPFKPRSPNVLEPQTLHELKSRFDALIRLSQPELANMAAALSGSGYAVILTDDKGLILHHQVEDNLTKEFQRAGLWQGADWGEEHVGTNGIGTCISEMRPVTVHRDEHFLRQNIDLSCSAAPILDPHGNLLTVLDASCCGTEDSRASQIHTRALVVSYARLIESRYFLREFRNQRVLRFHSRVECVALPNEAMLALGEDNRILAANIVALQLLGIDDRRKLIGKNLSELVGNELDSLLFASMSNEGTVLPFCHPQSGVRFFGFIYKYKEPAPLRGLTIKPATQSADECRGELCNLNKLAGEDPQMLEAAKRALRVVDKRIPILIQGETGTGKDLFTQAIHKASKRQDKPFVALNCASIPESLIESELFGYKHGAFTGARKEGRRGKLIESSGGTLFLDEIGDMPLNMQSRLLRVLETEEVVPLGSEQLIKVDLNIVAATHHDLVQLINEGSFREDLYYRLNGITLYLPPLRERQDLRNIILKVLEAENDTGRKLQITPEAISHLLKYPWPGNLRQLRNVLRTAVALCDGDVIDSSHINLPTLAGRNQNHNPAPATRMDPPTDKHEDPSDVEAASDNPLKSAEYTVIRNALKTYDWNISRTAEALEMSRNTLYRKIQKHNIKQESD